MSLTTPKNKEVSRQAKYRALQQRVLKSLKDLRINAEKQSVTMPEDGWYRVFLKKNEDTLQFYMDLRNISWIIREIEAARYDAFIETIWCAVVTIENKVAQMVGVPTRGLSIITFEPVPDFVPPSTYHTADNTQRLLTGWEQNKPRFEQLIDEAFSALESNP